MTETQNFTTLDEWLHHIETLHAKPIDMGLERMQMMVRKMGIRFSCPVITVGGTNGKGSTVGMLESIYRAAGYKTCAHTSPHLLRFNERARINGIEASDEDRDAAVISTIGIDHTAFLGNTREAIASEKACIYRPGCPAVCSDADVPSTLSAYVEKIGANGIYAGRDFRTVVHEDGTFDWEGEGVRLEKLPRPALLGVNQYRNAAGVLAVVTALQAKLPVSREAIEKGLETVRLTARFETVSQDPCPIVLDVGHNPEAAAVLAQNIRLTKREGERTMAVFGMLADKDMESVARLLKDSFDDWFIASLTGPRAASATLLKAAMLRAGVPEDRIESYTTVEAALAQARFVAKNLSERPSGTVRIIVFGSFVTVTAALEALAAHA